MKKLVSLLATVVIVAGIFSPSASLAAEKPSPAKTQTPGVQMARTLSEITGVAISPLLGVGAIGWYQFAKAKTPEQRARLPWFASPWFFIPALVVVGLCLVKDTAGTALPTALKKPLDVIDAVEHKISGLVATGAFVPIMVSFMNEANSTASGPTFSAMGLAAVDASWIYNLLMTPVFMVLFIIVFLASNAVNILILLSPFTTVDAALKLFRTTVLASVLVSAQVNPWVGAFWALLIVAVSYFIAGWSFRLSHFGIVFIWEFLSFRRKRFVPSPASNKLFLSRAINQAPARTYGKLSRDENGHLVLRYRPWLVLPARTVTLPAGEYEVGRGLFYSEIFLVEGESTRTMILLPPRYRGHEDELARIYSLGASREVGLRAAWSWLKGMFGSSAPAPAVA